VWGAVCRMESGKKYLFYSGLSIGTSGTDYFLQPYDLKLSKKNCVG